MSASASGTNNEAAATNTTTTSANNNLEVSAQTYNHQCYICDKIFSANSNLNRHLRKIHKEDVQSPYNNVKCALCDSIYSSSSIYNQHLQNDHSVQIEVEHLTLADKKSFEDWKHKIENDTTSQYIKSRGEKKTKNVNKTYYSCNRSGYYISKATTRKALKKQGSRKINGRCPASMNVTLNSDSTYDVRFVKTHVGHNFELRHLDLSDKDRDLIIQKLASGITKKDIIKQLRSAIDQQPSGIGSNKVHLTSNNGSANASSSASPAPATNSIEIFNATSEVIISSYPVTNSSQLSNLVTTTTRSTALEMANNEDVKPQQTSNPASALNCQIVDAESNLLEGSFTNQPTSRLYLATTKDIHNIINSKHLDSKLIRHNYDLNHIEAWISELREFNETSSVLLYKTQSELIDKYPKLREDDFMLAIMKEGQAEKLKRFGEKCIIIDSTHNVHCEYLHVTLISVIDDDDDERRGFPVALLFSSRTDIDVLDVFFDLIKSRVGTISTRMVIADELNDFYQAWTNVMTRPTHNLLTPWSVFDCWAKKFELIHNREKLRKLKKQLRGLLAEPDSDKFGRDIEKLIAVHRADPELKEFIKYFDEKFARNPDLWSTSLRKNSGATTSELWRIHDKFKGVYKDGKNSKKMCKYVATLMNLFEEGQLAWLSNFEDQLPSKRKAMIDRHNKSVETGSVVYEVAVKPIYWLCPSETCSDYYYEVRHSDSDSDPAVSISSEPLVLAENWPAPGEDGHQLRSSPRKAATNASSRKGPAAAISIAAVNNLGLDGGDHLSKCAPPKRIIDLPNGYLRGPSVKRPASKCCDLICIGCQVCRHEYRCSCLDYVVNLNMCKHVHRICTMCRT